MRQGLVEKLPPYLPSPGTKLTRVVSLWREILRHRLVDLASASIDLFSQGRLVPAITLTRSLLETTASLYYFHKKIDGARSPEDLKELTSLLAKGVFGSKDGSSEYVAIQVLTAIKHVDKEFGGFEKEYFNLCEFAHPNMKGGLGAYTKIRLPEYSVSLGQNPDGLPAGPFGLTALDIALELTLIIFARHKQTDRNFLKLVTKHAPAIFSD